MVKTQKNKVLKDFSSVLIATFAPFENGKLMPTNGMVEPMLSFFIPKVNKLRMIIQPHTGSDRINPIIQEYEAHTLKKTWILHQIAYFPIYLFCRLQNDQKTHISFKLRDFISVMIVGIFFKERYDYFIGLESINTLAGILLRKIGKVDKVIYYVSDYSPQRFAKRWFNYIYIYLDRLCITHSDYTWDVSPVMQNARVNSGLKLRGQLREIIVPNGLFPSQIATVPIAKRIPYSIVFMGTLGFENGPDLAIEAVAIIKKEYPQVRLHIVGGGEQNLNRLRLLVTKLNIEKFVIFHGFILDSNKMAKIVRHCYVAVAPYRAIPNSVRWYADATKIRQYLASGLPIVTTPVPPLGKYVSERGAAIIVSDTTKEFAAGIIKIFADPKLYSEMETQATNLGKENTWEKVYAKAFADMKKLDA